MTIVKSGIKIMTSIPARISKNIKLKSLVKSILQSEIEPIIRIQQVIIRIIFMVLIGKMTCSHSSVIDIFNLIKFQLRSRITRVIR
jgi:hypothetical protein